MNDTAGCAWFKACPCAIQHTVLSKDACKVLKQLGETFCASSFDWSLAEPLGLLNKCAPVPKSGQPTCGKILTWCKERITSFRQKMNIRLCIFKIGVTSNPPQRYPAYLDVGFTSMWVLAVNDSCDLIHMLEAALISEFCKHVGCRNKEGSGGDGALNKKIDHHHPTMCM